MSINNIETEAKFIIKEVSIFDALQETTKLEDFELKPIGIRTVVDRYLDTTSRHMYRAGFACRIRTIGDKQILTLKSLTPAEGTMHRRQEIELDIEAEDPQAWEASEAKDLVLGIVGTTPLESLFVIHQTRHKFSILLDGQPVIELSLDKVSLNESDTVDYFGLEAELEGDGSESDLDRFVKALQANWLLQPDSLSKFERGLANLNQQSGGEFVGLLVKDQK